jgi:hypothetical protein
MYIGIFGIDNFEKERDYEKTFLAVAGIAYGVKRNIMQSEKSPGTEY